MTASIISVILAIFKAVPIFEKWFDQIHDAKIDAMKKQNHDSVDESAKTGDQRSIEEAMGSTKTGKPSGVPGTEIVHKLPGVE